MARELRSAVDITLSYWSAEMRTRSTARTVLGTGRAWLAFTSIPLALAAVASAQAPTVGYRADVGFPVGIGFGSGGHFEVDSTDHVYAAPGGAGYALTRVDPDGRVLWTRQVTGVGTMKAFDVAVDSQDNAILTGYDQGTFSFVTTKFDSAGNELWKRVRKDGLKDEAFSIAVDAADNVYVTGHSTNATTFSVEFMTIKYDSAGNEQWLRRGPFGQPIRLEVTSAGRVAITGDAGNAFITVSYDTDGNELWADDYTPATARPYDLEILESGDVFVCGSGGPELTGLVVHYAPDGEIEWVANHTSPLGGWDLYRAMTIASSGNVVAVGQAINGWTVTVFDAAGQFLWNQFHPWSGSNGSGEYAFGVTTDAAGAVYVSGGMGPDICPLGAFNGTDSVLRKYSAEGVLLWERQMACTGSNTGTVALDARGGILFAAWEEIIRLDPNCALQAGSEIVRLGEPPNVFGFKPGTSGPPCIGEFWDPIIDHNVFAPNARTDFIMLSTQPGINVSHRFGTLLVNPPPARQVFFNTRTQRRIYIPIPGGCSLVGFRATAQAGSFTPDGPQLTNALDIVLGAR